MYKAADSNRPERHHGSPATSRPTRASENGLLALFVAIFVGATVLLTTHSLTLSPLFALAAFVIAFAVFHILALIIGLENPRR